MRLGKNRKVRKNRKIRYNEELFLNKHYVEHGKAVIPILLEDINDLYMKHDYKKLEMSNKILEYVEEVADMVPMDMDIVLEVHCPKVDEQQQEKMAKVMKNNFAMEMDDADFEVSRINRKAIIYAVAGLIILAFNLILEEYIGAVLSNFICVIWWVAIWDMAELLTMEKPEWKWKRLNYQQLYDSQITFVFDVEK